MTYTYKKCSVGTASIIRKEDGACIPIDEGNSDYQTYLEWAKTNTIEEAD